MLLLAYLIKRDAAWEEAVIRVLTVPEHSTATDRGDEAVKQLLNDVRIAAQVEFVEDRKAETIAAHSGDAALVFMPFRLQGNRMVGFFQEALEEILEPLSVVALVLAAEDIDLDAEPEEGKAAEMAEATDALEDAKKRAEETQKEVKEAKAESEEMTRRLNEAKSEGKDIDLINELEAGVTEAQERMDKALRKSGKAMARLEAAEKTAEAAGVFEKRTEEARAEDTDSE
ncbi:MAG: hypothetical protein U5R49_07830 [Deltaproteobacteria bacterium]|nr:hypothetical protein [Deltaproteobacteria bacterium]